MNLDVSSETSFRDTSRYKVVVLPDFFIDVIVDAGSLEDFVEKVNRVYLRGGGNILVRSRIQRGGNAANTAAALSALGVRTVLISKVDPTGAKLLRALMPDVKIVLNESGETPITVALEFERGGSRSNVMLSSSGSVRQFTIGDIPTEGIEELLSADLIAVMNLAQNLKGNELVRDVRKLVGGEKIIYVDPSDVTNALDRLSDFVEAMRNGAISVLAVNENEAMAISKALGYSPKDVFEAAESIYREVKLWRLDVHTEEFSFSLPSGAVVPSFDVNPIISTGAGDAWNGGNILGYLMGFEDEERLKLANAVAGFYISRGRHGKLYEVLEFMDVVPLMRPRPHCRL